MRRVVYKKQQHKNPQTIKNNTFEQILEEARERDDPVVTELERKEEELI
jgi:hypothetical protein